MKKIIITARSHPMLEETLAARGYTILNRPQISYEELESEIVDAVGLVVTTRLKIDKNLLGKATKLEWIGRLGSGMELIDTDYARSRNIQCFSSGEGNRDTVAEHVLGLLLDLMNNISKSNIEVSTGKWLREENRAIELKGKTVGIIGYGNTGSTFSKLLSAFDLTVLAYDKYKFGFGSGYVKEASLEQICRYSDIISFHVPLTHETHHMGNADFFESLHLCPFILNSSRGKVLDTDALVNALKAKKVRGAGLDVLENENIQSMNEKEREQFDFLSHHPQVIITPHIAGYSNESFLKMSQVLLGKLGF